MSKRKQKRNHTNTSTNQNPTPQNQQNHALLVQNNTGMPGQGLFIAQEPVFLVDGTIPEGDGDLALVTQEGAFWLQYFIPLSTLPLHAAEEIEKIDVQLDKACAAVMVINTTEKDPVLLLSVSQNAEAEIKKAYAAIDIYTQTYHLEPWFLPTFRSIKRPIHNANMLMCRTQLEIGMCYFSQLDLAAALKPLEHALELQEEYGAELTEKDRADNLCGLYTIYSHFKNTLKAHEVKQKIQKLPSQYAFLILNFSQGANHIAKRDWEKARFHYHIALEFAMEQGFLIEQAASNTMIADAYIAEYKIEILTSRHRSIFKRQDELLHPVIGHLQESRKLLQKVLQPIPLETKQMTIEAPDPVGAESEMQLIPLQTNQVTTETNALVIAKPEMPRYTSLESNGVLAKTLDLMAIGLEDLAKFYTLRAKTLPDPAEKEVYLKKAMDCHILLGDTLKLFKTIGKEKIFNVCKTGEAIQLLSDFESNTKLAFAAMLKTKLEVAKQLKEKEAQKQKDAENRKQAEKLATEHYDDFIKLLNEEKAQAKEAQQKAILAAEAREKSRLEMLQKTKQIAQQPRVASSKHNRKTKKIPLTAQQGLFQQGCGALGESKYNVVNTRLLFEQSLDIAIDKNDYLSAAKAEWGIAETYSKQAYQYLREGDFPAAMKQFETCSLHISEGIFYTGLVFDEYKNKAAPEDGENLRNCLEIMAGDNQKVTVNTEHLLDKRELVLSTKFKRMLEERNRAIYRMGLRALGWDEKTFFSTAQTTKPRPTLEDVWQKGLSEWKNNPSPKNNHANEREKCEIKLEETRQLRANIGQLNKGFDYLSQAAEKQQLTNFDAEKIKDIVAPASPCRISDEDKKPSIHTLIEDCLKYTPKTIMVTNTVTPSVAMIQPQIKMEAPVVVIQTEAKAESPVVADQPKPQPQPNIEAWTQKIHRRSWHGELNLPKGGGTLSRRRSMGSMESLKMG